MKEAREENSIYDVIIIKYLSDTISREELLGLNDWLEIKPANKRYFEQTRELWLMTKVIDNPKGFDDRTGFARFLENSKSINFKSSRSLYSTFARIAAVFILAFLTGGYAHYLINPLNSKTMQTAYYEVSVPYGSKTTVALPDGTTVNLNAGSKLSYRAGYGVTDRIVSLEGEGYFSVAKDKKRAFIVSTNSINIKAFGTEFNVKAYNEDDCVHATLIEGSIGITSTLDAKDDVTMLVPNQKATINKKTLNVNVEYVDVKLSAGWRDDKIYFEDESFAAIAKTIERTFNVTLKITTPELANEIFSGSMDKRKSIYQILDGLGAYGNFSYAKQGDTIILKK